MSFVPIDNVHHYSVITFQFLVEKKEYLGTFTIQYTTKYFNFTKDLCNFSTSINLMSLELYSKLGLGLPWTYFYETFWHNSAQALVVIGIPSPTRIKDYP